ncbi:MAG: hypothetical protein CVV64_15585 [Candidatus Wallbacteria bacterium HGW-Wallbacteria-1]|jgi:hypothetical protein|uniref:Uncharacterized protein n=1 Tax=Candidatus Wallbacteria bacterium HGW-Wallbacteria-1 TaxID=2013854 RepID=A0A2N1PLD0_9BACT|nr:MAG: hypothetical protein CVV64_15585 [Candidatus Wallbacteria bacterium HGW-Wallbacteria-1]
MTYSVKLIEETPAGEQLTCFMDLSISAMTVEDLLMDITYHQVARFRNSSILPAVAGHIPDERELLLNGPKMRQRLRVSVEKQFQIARDAFLDRRILLIINDRQMDSLTQEVILDETTAITFLKLVPLIGG